MPGGSQLLRSQCVVLAVGDKSTDADIEPASEWPSSDADRLQAIRNAGIVGLGGAAFPTADKLGTTGALRHVDTERRRM